MQSDLSHTHGVKTAASPSINKAATVAVINVIPTTRPQAPATSNLVRTLRTTVLPKENLTTYVTGTTAGAVDFTDRITSRLLWLILAVIAISYFLLTMAFRSIVIATKAAILNLLSIGAAVGVIVAIFQWGWLKEAIGLHTTLPIPAYVPMLVFCIVFGLSMDYEVFLLSRIHEAWLLDRRRAPQRRDRDRRDRQGDHDGGRDHGDGVRQLRAEHRPDHQDARARHGVRRADRRVAGPDGAGAVGDDAARTARLVDAALDGADRAKPAPGGRRDARASGRVASQGPGGTDRCRAAPLQ